MLVSLLCVFQAEIRQLVSLAQIGKFSELVARLLEVLLTDDRLKSPLLFSILDDGHGDEALLVYGQLLILDPLANVV